MRPGGEQGLQGETDLSLSLQQAEEEEEEAAEEET